MNMIFTMCFTGSVLFLLYLCVRRSFRKFLSPRWNDWMMKILLCSFLTPLGLVERLAGQMGKKQGFYWTEGQPLLVMTQETRFSNLVYRNNTAIVILWLWMAVVIFLWQRWKYVRVKRIICSSMREIRDPMMLESVKGLCRELGIKRPVKLFESDYVSPFTMGIKSPLVVLPLHLSEEKKCLVLRHELIHIRRGDSFWLFFQHMISCFYWFNPLVYGLHFYTEKTFEIRCDEAVVQNFDRQKRKEYASLLLELAAERSGKGGRLAPSFNAQKKILKERLDEIMKKKEKVRYGGLVSGLLGMVMILGSSLTALAYQPPMVLEMEYKGEKDFEQFDWIRFEMGPYERNSVYGELRYEKQFTDENGVIYPVETEKLDVYSACDHQFFDGVYLEHTKNKDGSCIIQIYEAKRCGVCGYTIDGDLIVTETYTKCSW